MDMFLEAKQYLGGINGFDQIIGYFLSDRLLHDMFLFGLSDHHYRHFGMQTLDLLQRLQTRHTRHVLIQKNDVRHGLVQHVYRIFSISSGGQFVPLTLQINDIRLQQVYLVVNPKYLAHNVSIY